MFAAARNRRGDFLCFGAGFANWISEYMMTCDDAIREAAK
jgi:hypothetical protein